MPVLLKVTGRFGLISGQTPGRFSPILFLSGCIGLGHFSLIFVESFRPTSFCTVLIGNKKIFWLVLFILCSFIDNKKFSWLPRLIYAVFIDNKVFLA